MGMGPAEVDQCGLWQFQASSDGFRRANMSEEDRAKELTVEEADELSAWVDS